MVEPQGLARRIPGTHLPPGLRVRVIGVTVVERLGRSDVNQSDLVLLARLAEGLGRLNDEGS